MFRQIRSKLLAAFVVPLAVIVGVAGVAISSGLSQTRSAKDEREAVALAAIGLAGALLGLVLVIRVSRAVSRPLAHLAKQAEHLANVALPATVQAILDAGTTGAQSPEVPKLNVGNIEEVAAVATALEALNQTAVELASGQAALRRNLSDAFVNLGRRNQNLVTRQLEYITEIELKEPDPDSLDDLFRLDHLATRMRRNAESLLVLAGSGPARQWSAAVPVMDVARAASAEVEDYKRLALHHFDAAMVAGVVTTDLVHILAELIENALSFSPPGAPVDLYGRLLEGGYVIVIVDSGIGMSSENLAVANRRLEGQSDDGGVPGRYLGHFVAGRLAARHGIDISLQPSHSSGLVARVKVPASFVEGSVADLSAGAEVSPAPDNAAPVSGASEPATPPTPAPVNEAVLGLAQAEEPSAAGDGNGDGPGAVHGNGVTDLGAVWARMPDLWYDGAGTGDATNPVVAGVHAPANYGAQPYDWSLPVAEPEPVATVEGTAANDGPSGSDSPAQEESPAEADVTERRFTGTPDLGADAPLAALLPGSGANTFRPGPAPFDAAPQPEKAGPVPVSARLTVPTSAGLATPAPSRSASASRGAPSLVVPVPVVGPAAQARSTAAALRKLTRRVPGASLPEDDGSLRRPNAMSTTRNPLGLPAALSQYLSVTVEGRPAKEHNPR